MIWSPKGEWLALSLAPGGGMNTQIFVVRADGTGLRRLTDGGKETNNLGDWTADGARITMGSNSASPATIDAYLADPVSGARTLVSANNGLQTVEDVSRDGRRALVSRLRGRGDNDLYLIDSERTPKRSSRRTTRPGRSPGNLLPTAARFIWPPTRIGTGPRS